MYSPNASPPNTIAITTEKASPHSTQTIDSVSASLGGGSMGVAMSVQIDRQQGERSPPVARSTLPTGRRDRQTFERSASAARSIRGILSTVTNDSDSRKSRYRLERRSGGRAANCRTDEPVPWGYSPSTREVWRIRHCLARPRSPCYRVITTTSQNSAERHILSGLDDCPPPQYHEMSPGR